MKKVITYGTFDLFHQGHYNILKRAKEYGDYLIVGVTSESYDIERGKLSVKDSLTTRIQNVMNTGFVDEVIIEEYLGQKIRDIIKYDIDVIVIGSDWKGKFDHLKQYCEVVYLERTKNISSTQIREEKNSIFKLGVLTDNFEDNELLEEIKYVSGLHIESICSDNRDVMNSFYETFRIHQKFDNISSFLDSIDVVLVLSDYEKRYEQVKQSLLEGKHVITNTPMTLDLDKHKELFDLAKEKNVILIENIVTVYLRAFLQILYMAKGDILGNLLKVRAVLSLENFDSKKTFIDALVLGLIMIIKLLGTNLENINVTSISNNVDYVHILFKKDNSIGCIEITNNIELKNELVIVGENGTIVVGDDWWNTGYFEFKNVNQKFDKKYSYNFEGNGFRYVLQELLIMLNDNRIEGTRLFRDESESMIKLLNDINIEKWVNINDKM